MPAEPLSPEEQADVDTIKLLAGRVERRGSYCTAFGEEVARLNAICARIFNLPKDDGPQLAGAERW
jgi:hypothetical protein